MSQKQPAYHPFLRLPGLPETSKLLVARLLEEPPVQLSELLESIRTYRLKIQDIAKRNGRANAALGVAIADTLEVFLARVDDRTQDEELRIIQTAVRYFVIENDGFGSDLAHEDGLFGDARVVNAMLRWFGRDDMFLPVPVAATERRPPPQPRQPVASAA